MQIFRQADPVINSMTEVAVSVARYIVSRIEAMGVDVIPVIQGSAIMKMIDEVGQSTKIKYVCPNHEQALAMIVDAYARLKGFGVGMVTSGPGGMNASTGIACAYYDSIPCLFITGQVGMFHAKGSRGVRQRGFQESDMISLLKPITKYAVLLDDPMNVRYEFEKAIYMAMSGRPGPVVIDLPYNVQRAMIDPATLIGFSLPKDDCNDLEVRKAVQKVMKELASAHRPVLLAGGGVRISNQTDALYSIVDSLQVPIVTTWGAIDVFEKDHPLYLGNIGRSGNASAVQIVQQADVLVSLGCRFTTKEIIDEKLFAQYARVLSVDIDSSELYEGLIDPHVKIQSDLKKFLPAFAQEASRAMLPQKSDDFILHAKKLKKEEFTIDATRKEGLAFYVSPYLLVRLLSELLLPSDIVIADVGVNLTWIAQAFEVKRGQRILSAWGCSPMGYAFPAALGAHLANPNARVIAIIGDGGMQMNIQELQTVFFNNYPIKTIVLNNSCYASIRSAIRELFGGRTCATDKENGYYPPDFVRIAEAYGLSTIKLSPTDDIASCLRAFLAINGPALMEVPTDPDQYVFDNSPDLLREASGVFPHSLPQ